MNETSEVLIQIKVSEDEVKEKVEAARANLARLRTEEANLQKERKAGIITAKEFAASQKAIASNLGATTKALQEGEATLASYAKSEKQANQGLDQMRSGLALLSPVLKDVSVSQSKQAINSLDLQKRISELSAEFAKDRAVAGGLATSMAYLDKQIVAVDEAIRQLTAAELADLEVGGKLLKLKNDLTKEQEKNQKVIDGSKKGIKEYIRDVDVLGINVGATVDSFKSGAQGAGTFAKAIFTGRGALVALAAVPIIAVLTGLYIILTKSQKGMDFLAQATSGVSAVFSSLSAGVINAVEAFANSKNKLADLGNFLEQNLINRFKALGVILEGIYTLSPGKISNGLLQLATGSTNAATNLKKAYDQGVALAKMNQEIEESEIRLNTQRARSEKFIERQKQISEDTTKSTQVRAAAARSAFAESERIQNAEAALQAKRVAAAVAESKQNQNDRASQKKVSEEKAKLDELAKNRIGERTELQNQLNSINQEGAAKDLENAKKVAAAEAAEAETALIQAKKKGLDTVEIEAEILKRTLTFIQARADAEKVGVEKGKGQAQQRKLIQAKADEEMLEAALQTAVKISEIIYNASVRDNESALAVTRRGSKAELDLRIEAIEAARNKQQAALKVTADLLEKNRKAGLISQDEYDKASVESQLENGRLVIVAARAISDAKIEFAQSEVNLIADIEDKRLQTSFDLGQQSLANERKLAADRIDLEEKTQLKLLELEQIAEKDRDVKRAAIEAKAIKARKELATQEVIDEAQKNSTIARTKLANAKEGSKAEHDAILAGIEADRAAQLAAANGNQVAIDLINAEANKARSKENERFGKEQLQKTLALVQQSLSVLQTLSDAQSQQLFDEFDKQQAAALKSAGTNVELREKIEDQYAHKKEKLDKAEAERKKKYATAQAVINTAVGITSASPNIALMILAGLTGIAQLAAIKATKFEQGGINPLGRGGYQEGPSHAQGGVKYRVGNRQIELEGGEAIINKKSTRKYYKQLSAINQSEGGRAFPGVGPQIKANIYTPHIVPKFNITPMFAYGGVVSNGNGPILDPQQLAGMIEVGIANALINQKPPVLVVSDLHTVEADMSRLNRRTSVKV